MAAKFYKGIRTLYAGVWFKSQLEASWATYFDAYGIGWKYEPKTFKLVDYGSYRPDFEISLNGRELFVEVKPRKKMVSLDQWIRIHQFIKQWRKALVMVYGKPGPGPHSLEEFSKPIGEVLLTVSKQPTPNRTTVARDRVWTGVQAPAPFRPTRLTCASGNGCWRPTGRFGPGRRWRASWA